MFLERLSQYAERLADKGKLPPPLYEFKPVRYIIELDQEGHLRSPQPTDTADPSDRATKNGRRFWVPSVGRSGSQPPPLLLVDHAFYTLGLARPDREDKDLPRVAAAHEAYVDLVRRCAQETGEPSVEAILAFLEDDPTGKLVLDDDYDHRANIMFRVENTLPIDQASVKAFWVKDNESAAAPVMQCIVCGHERPVLERLKGKIKRIPGGQSSGMSIISANENAYESYGLKNSLISPICAGCAERMTQALNNLLSDEAHSFRMGSGVFVFWTREESPGFGLRTLLAEPTAEDVRALYRSVYTTTAPEVEENRFYAALLTASGGRVVVRDWIDTSLRAVQENLARWFDAQEMIGAWGDEHTPRNLYALAATTVRDLSKDLPPTTLPALLRAAIMGSPLPFSLLSQVLARCRIPERNAQGESVSRITHPQAAMIRLVLANRLESASENVNKDDKEAAMKELELSNDTPAYLCGRLLAVLEAAQRGANPKIKATLVDRFYGTAATAPATVFGTLLQGAQAHLSKLLRDAPGVYHAIQVRLEDILSGLDGFPRTLSLEEQGLFALGYYHQRADQRARAIQASSAHSETTQEDIS